MVHFDRFFRIFDIFQKQFIFYIGNTKAKSTILGGFLSFSVFSISFFYLFYLLNLFFSNQIEPKISISQYIDAGYRELSLDKEFLMFQMMIKGKPLNLVEKQMGKKYLKIYLKYIEVFFDNSIQEQQIEFQECQDQNFQGYFCADYQAKSLKRDTIKQYDSLYGIFIEPCTGQPDCASKDEIVDFIFHISNYFYVAIKTKQYNKLTQSFQDQVFTEFYYFDQNLYLFSRLYITLGETSIKSGNVIQSTQKTKSAYEYKRNDVIYSQEKIEQKFQKGFGYINVQLDQKSVDVSIQYPMITEVFAQFMSILNTIFIVGVLARTFAQAGIINDLIEILLKEYYKQTAVKLLNTKENNIKVDSKLKNKNNCNNEFSKSEQKQKIEDKQEQILNINKKINSISFTQNEKKFLTSIFQRIKSFINKVFRTRFKIDKPKIFESKIYDRIIQEALQRVDIYSIYSDILKLKMAIKLIFTKEQYAAFQYCGSEFVVENQFKQDNKEESQVKQVINHNQAKIIYVVQDEIDYSSNINNILSNNALIPSSLSEAQNKKSNEKNQKDIQKPIQNKFDQDDQSEKQIYFNTLPFASRPTIGYNNQISNRLSIKNSIINQLSGDQEGLDLRSSQEIQIFSHKTQEEKTQQTKNNKQQESDSILKNNNQCQFTQMQKNKFEINQLETFDTQQKQYLYEMDKIESIPQIREQYFKIFIQNIKDNQPPINRIDLNLYNNLINTQSPQMNHI